MKSNLEKAKRARDTLDRLAAAFERAAQDRSLTFKRGMLERMTVGWSKQMKDAFVSRIDLTGGILAWKPSTESDAMTLPMPEGWTEIEDMENLMALVEIRLRDLLLADEDPYEAAKYLLQALEMAGLIGPVFNARLLAQGDHEEIFQLMQSPELRVRLSDLANVNYKDFPLIPTRIPDPEISLSDWVNEVTMF